MANSTSLTLPYYPLANTNAELFAAGGPWLCTPSDPINMSCEWTSPWWCDNEGCIDIQVARSVPTDDYSVTISTSIFVDSSQFGGSASLPFYWAFYGTLWSSNITMRNYGMTVTSSVGNNSFTEYIIPQLSTDESNWLNATPLSRSGYVALPENPSAGPLNLTIGLDFNHYSQEFFEFNVRHFEFGLGTLVHNSSQFNSTTSKPPPVTHNIKPQSSNNSGTIAGIVIAVLVLMCLCGGASSSKTRSAPSEMWEVVAVRRVR